MAEKPQLRLINFDTGEVVEDERDVLIEQQASELRGKSLQIGKLKREVRELRAAEPESIVIREVLDYWKERCKPTAHIAVAGKRWEKVRARLRDKFDHRDPWTVAELKLAVDGALLDPWLSGRDRKSKGYLDAETIFRDSEMVERLRDLAIGFKAKAGVDLAILFDTADIIPMLDWPLLMEACTCGHRRMEHARADPTERCYVCDCQDWDYDWTDPYNIKREERR